MGRLEESIVASMVALQNAEPECGQHMFVFPTSLMNDAEAMYGDRCRILREKEVLLVCRPSD